MSGRTASGVPLVALALGTFAIGTDAFVVAGILPRAAGDLGVSASAVGQLVTLYTLVYALSAPLLATVTARICARTLTAATMTAAAGANVMAACSDRYLSLMAANVVLALAAALYVPAANALAAALVRPERRGLAIAIVNTGLTLSIAMGVPLGALLAEAGRWHLVFVIVAAICLAAAGALWMSLPAALRSPFGGTSLRQRLQLLTRPALLPALLTTTLWAAGTYTVYTYLALWLRVTLPAGGASSGAVFAVWGVAAGCGVLVAGSLVDRLGPLAVVFPCLLAGAVTLAGLSFLADGGIAGAGLLPAALACVAAWGMAHWGFYPGQQTRLIGLAGLPLSPVALSLNASFLYLGRCLGAALGGVLVAWGQTRSLGYAASLLELASMGVLILSARGAVRRDGQPLIKGGRGSL